jgi:hypothetical protein
MLLWMSVRTGFDIVYSLTLTPPPFRNLDWSILPKSIQLGFAFIAFRMGIRRFSNLWDEHFDG